ncbi:hypothetical protein [uncultured Rikenella sp.]|uniref:hypothetical protein n=1 Tax=uncultured Rikenella sp. TaxID=368003 RepID=UPI00260E7A10|nr:hypothetical protein [uncultured Rikenella sp.]
MTINERLSLLIKALGLNNNSFARKLDVNPAVTFNIIEGRKTKPSYDLLEKIVFTFDNINLCWLLKGEGEMFRPDSAAPEPSGSPEPNPDAAAVQNELIALLKKQLDEANRLNQDLMQLLKKNLTENR